MFSITRVAQSKRQHALRQAIESLENRVLLAYTLDPTFDSKFVLMGPRTMMHEGVSGSGHYFLRGARLNSDGSWDPSFPGDGLVESEQDANLMSPWMTAGGVQSDGKIIAASAQSYSP